MNKELTEQVLKEWTNLKLKARKLKSEKSCLKSENKRLKFKVNWLLTIISLGLIAWLSD